MKKRGFTLIELIVYLAVVAIISSVAVTSIASVNNFKIEYTNKIYQKEIALLIHRARMYCYEKGVDGSINLDFTYNTIMFVSDNVRIDELFLEDKKWHSKSLRKIAVDAYGNLDNAGKILFKDERNKIKEITIHVASGFVDEK